MKVNTVFKDINNSLYTSNIDEVKPFLPLKLGEFDKLEKISKIDLPEELKSKVLDLLHFNLYETTKVPYSKRDYSFYYTINAVLHSNSNYIKSLDVCNSTVYKTLKEVDKNACLVGGCVRDVLIDKEPNDFDFVTSVDYNELITIFKEKGCSVDVTGANFLVMNVKDEKGDIYEVAKFRRDGVYRDNRHPEVVYDGTIEEDAKRRDFTVNALYFNLSSEIFVDPLYTGFSDLFEETPVLRFVGKPEDRLKEDSLRAVRFYRFVGKGFKADTHSLRAVRSHFDECVKRTTPERIRAELEKMVKL